MDPKLLPRPRRPPLLSLDDEFFAEISDERVVVTPTTVTVRAPVVDSEPPPSGPAPFHDVGFDMDETAVLGPPSASTARGWAHRADKVLAPVGKTLRDAEGRMLFTRADFLRVPVRVLHTLVAYGLQVDAGRIPWGVFRDEEDQFDREANWERLRSWLEER
jgi:hypothetical protein